MVYVGFAAILPVPLAVPMPGQVAPGLLLLQLLHVTPVTLVCNIARGGMVVQRVAKVPIIIMLMVAV